KVNLEPGKAPGRVLMRYRGRDVLAMCQPPSNMALQTETSEMMSSSLKEQRPGTQSALMERRHGTQLRIAGIYPGRKGLTRAVWQPSAVRKARGVRGFTGPPRPKGIVVHCRTRHLWMRP